MKNLLMALALFAYGKLVICHRQTLCLLMADGMCAYGKFSQCFLICFSVIYFKKAVRNEVENSEK
ncbi:hypothetical protein D0T50_02045 [Bacteroides sp. 214]|uniref:hypothetical protein n=1 Tax=Bacteroides sp. 214 TaxID=2302935 RepID=UPI0013D6BAB3|nr:hypothetical protein [Bacteroides sp. 214]NDW11669.1 hypothetical protein [Bacteroides sp. 214]